MSEPILQDFDFSVPFGFKLRVVVTELREKGKCVALSFIGAKGAWAQGQISMAGEPVDVQVSRIKSGISLRMQCGATRWSARLIPGEDRTIQIVERAVGSSDKVSWDWIFIGSILHTHKQLSVVSTPSRDARFRMGAFTQYGQLFDLRDWALVQDEDQCAGLIGIRVGKWSHPTVSCIHARGTNTGVTFDMRWGDNAGNPIRRSYLLVQASTELVTTPQILGIDYFEPAEGYAAWPAEMIARYGFARRERLAAGGKLTASIQWKRPGQFIFGDAKLLDRALQRASLNPRLSDHQPLWEGNFLAAQQNMLSELTRFHTALIAGAFLHPLGNPVAIRPLAPMFVLFHILDFLGHLEDAGRNRVAHMIADLAELLMRPDFYPNNYATKEPEYPYGPKSLYRGMLNQNFNTDCYITVGIAGCVLQQHPRAATWRRHAVEQFHEQMNAYVWPGGAWEESHTYANHVKATLLPFIVAMRQMPERLDLMQDSKFRDMCRFFVLLLSPPDAVIQGKRGIPAIGDHGYLHDSYTNIFGWLATACDGPGDPDHAGYLWAWHVTDDSLTQKSELANLFNPLFLPDRPVSPKSPQLPGVLNLPGFGVLCRGGTVDKEDETLFIVRCGQSWAHYHFDQGSFWWWAKGRLICCDADLGSGELKFAHRGHNVLGYPGRDPLQFLDRQNFVVDQYEPQPNGGVHVRCQITVASWGPKINGEQRIPVDQRPHLTRRFEYDGQHQLRIIDEPTNAPDGKVMWCLHVPAKSATYDGALQVQFHLADGVQPVRVHLPTAPLDVTIKQFGHTTALFCTYHPEPLVHLITL